MAPPQSIETVAAIHRVLLHGSSFPSVVETTSGRLYVMKLAGAGPGRRALATEHVALTVAHHLGLDVPEVVLLHLPRNLPWRVGTDEFYEAAQRSVGVNLGVAYIADAHPVAGSGLPSLPLDFLRRLGAVDALMQNVDRTDANPNIIRDRAGAYWAIDFGACLLIDRLARGVTQPRIDLPANHFLAPRADLSLDVRGLAGGIPQDCIDDIAAALPEPWLAELNLSRGELWRRLWRYIEGVRAT